MQQDIDTFVAIEDQVRAYIVESFLSDKDMSTFSNDADLLTILDSLQILRMVIALEKQYGFKVDESELAPENLGSVSRIGAFIARREGVKREA